MQNQNQSPEDSYLKVARASLESLDAFLMEDVDLLSKYLVLRFLKTSPLATSSSSSEERMRGLEEYLNMVYPFLVTFVMSVNSLPFGESTA